MPKYHGHSLQLSDKEEEQFQEIKRRTGFGVKKIFMAMIGALNAPVILPEAIVPEAPIVPEATEVEPEEN